MLKQLSSLPSVQLDEAAELQPLIKQQISFAVDRLPRLNQLLFRGIRDMERLRSIAASRPATTDNARPKKPIALRY